MRRPRGFEGIKASGASRNVVVALKLEVALIGRSRSLEDAPMVFVGKRLSWRRDALADSRCILVRVIPISRDGRRPRAKTVV